MFKVYLDFDDVISETFVALSAFAKAEFGRTPVPDKQIHFDLRESLGIPDAEYGRFMDRFHAEMLEDIPEMPGAAAAMRGWMENGAAEPVVVTGRPFSAHGASVRWLERRGLGAVQVLHVDKYARFGGETAGVVQFAALAGMGFRFAVDDAPAALDALCRAGFAEVVAFSRPWNAAWAQPADSAPGLPPPVRVASWTELDAAVRRAAAAPLSAKPV
ncbi:MAG: hypothetical protein IJ783_08895 [Kiritimatiellae bacterium]|nr:hypothetical protein [Kiritimatiellia bacterium]